MKHQLERTSPKGQYFIGTCTLCGKGNLTMSAVHEDCENVRGLTKEEALIEMICPTDRNGWKPIDSCPKETDVLLFNDVWADTFGEIQIGQIDHGGEWNFQSEMHLEAGDPDDFMPTHWMPLPQPPQS